MPALLAPAQVGNAAAAIASLRALPFPIAERALIEGVCSAQLAGRLQQIADAPVLMVDVAHNPQAARQLAQWLAAQPLPTRVVFSALKDKDVEAMVTALDPLVSHWYLAGITDAGARGTSADELAARLRGLIDDSRLSAHSSTACALAAARADSATTERIVVFGSFHTVADALKVNVPVRERL